MCAFGLKPACVVKPLHVLCPYALKGIHVLLFGEICNVERKVTGQRVSFHSQVNVCVFLLLFVASAIGEVARSAGGEVREKIYVVISVRCSIRTEYRAYIRYGFSTLAGRGCWFGCQDVLPSRGEILHR